MNRLIVYGDIHGCFDEFIELRKKLNPQSDDIEVCVGDIITKGKESLKTLHYIQEHNIKSVLGNHEEKLIRYLKHENSKIDNPINLDEDEKNIVKNLNQNDINFLISMPLFIKYKNITILHGGIQNHNDLNNLTKKEKSQLLRMRFLDKDNNFITYGNEDNDSVFWADFYNGNEGLIVYGHQWFKEVKINTHAIGIDTGCVYGNKLSAVVFQQYSPNTYKIESVQSKHIC